MKAGVALAGAGAIAFASVPMVSAAEEVIAAPRVVTTEVQPVVFSSLQILVEGAVAAVQESIHAWENDTPALINQLAAQWADHNLLPLNHAIFATALLAPLAPLAVGPFTDAIIEVVARALPGNTAQIKAELTAGVDYAFARLIGPLVSAIGATGATHAKVFEAGGRGDSVAHALALLMTPVDVINGFLFGGYGDISPLITGEVGGPRIPAPGLLTPWGQWPVDRSVLDDGAGTNSSLLAAHNADATATEPTRSTREDALAVKLAAAAETATATESATNETAAEATTATETATEAAPGEITATATETATEAAQKSAWSWQRGPLSAAPGATDPAATGLGATEPGATVSLDVKDVRGSVKASTGTSSASDTADKTDGAPTAKKSERASKSEKRASSDKGAE
ncbi:MAG: hypothetical protein WBB07_16605 [Mycobacterium sp.]